MSVKALILNLYYNECLVKKHTQFGPFYDIK